MKHLRQLLRRSGWLRANQRSNDQVQRGQTTSRRLSSEALERRELLAGDFASAHNYFLAHDVDNNMRVTPMDALAVINHLNRNGGQSTEVGQGEQITSFVDVNGDNRVTAADALSVINTLNRMGEGAGEPLLEVQLSARDGDSTELPKDDNGAYNVAVGQVFELEVGYLDLRDGDRIFQVPTGNGQTVDVRYRQGVFQLVADIGVTQSNGDNGGSLIQPIISETQQITVSKEIDNSEFTLALDISLKSGGNTVSTNTARIEAADFLADPTGSVAAALGTLEDANGAFLDSGTTVQVTRLPSADPDDFFLQVRFGGADSIGVNQPTINIQRMRIIPDVAEFPVGDPASNKEFRTDNILQGRDNGGLPIGERYDIDYASRTLPNPDGGTFSFLGNRSVIGSFVPDPANPAEVFDNVGGLGPVVAGGVPESSGGDGDTLDTVFDALSIPVFINAPVQGLTFEVTPGEDDNGESFLVYGFLEEPNAAGNDNSRPVPVDQVRFDSDAKFIINATADGGAVQPGTIAITPATVSLAEGDSGTTTATFTVTRTGGTDGEVSVQFATGAVTDTATAGQDYVAKMQTVTFVAGDGASKTITVDINGDTDVEPNETFTATISAVTGGASLGTTTSTVTITNDDTAVVNPGTISLSPATISIDEGDSGTKQATFTISRSGGTDGAVSVQFATGAAADTATAGSDYTAKTQTVTFADGDGVSKTITVDIIGDLADENNETFTVKLSSATGGATLGAAQSIVTINDDDTTVVNPGTISLSPATISIDEGDSGTKQATFTISRSGGTDGAVSVQFTTGAAADTATAGSDYTAKTQTVTFADGDGVSKTITVDIIGDLADENNETFTVNLSSATGGATLGVAQSIVTINDDDTTVVNPGTISLSPATISIDEGDSGTKQATFTISRSGGTDGAVSVQFATGAAADTATAGSDYTAKTQTVTFADGDGVSKTITVDIIGDLADENNETFTVKLSSATGGATLGAAQSIVTINDDDTTVVNPGTISLSPATVSVNENGSVATFTITRTGGSDGVVSVVFATSGVTATAGVDYTEKTQTVTFADGDTTAKTVTVAILEDTIDEPNETFNVTIANPTGGAALGAKATAVTIIDNDPTDPGSGSTVEGSIFVDKVENLSEVASSGGTVVPYRNGMKDTNEKGLAGVQVELRKASGELVATVYTDMDGHYRFTGVSQGSYGVVFGVSSTNVFLSGSNVVPVSVGPSSSTPVAGDLPVLGLSAAMSNLDILASSYLRGNSEAASASDNGRRGGSVALDAAGHQIFFMASEGFENVNYGELLLNSAKDAAIISIVQGTQVKTAMLNKEDFVISRDGLSLQFFGGVDELDFSSSPSASLGFSQASIDDLFSRAAQFVDNI